MTQDYTIDQPRPDSLQDALDLAVGVGTIAPGGTLRCTSVDQLAGVVSAAWLHSGHVALGAGSDGTIGLDRSGLDAIRELDVLSGLITVEVGASVANVEGALREEGLTLGDGHFSRPAEALGPALAAGEGLPLVVSIGAVLADGTVFHTPVAPRRATGPNPDALLVGAGERLAILAWATLRARPRCDQRVSLGFTGKGSAMLEATRTLYRGDVRPVYGSLRKHARGRVDVTIVLDGSRHRAEVEAHFAAAGGSAAEPDTAPPLPAHPRRLGWSALAPYIKGIRSPGLYVGNLERHGGTRWLPGDLGTGDADLAAVAARIDPNATLCRPEVSP